MDTSQQGSLFFRAGQPQHWKLFLYFLWQILDFEQEITFWLWAHRTEGVDDKMMWKRQAFLAYFKSYIVISWINSPPCSLVWPSIHNSFLFHLTVKVMSFCKHLFWKLKEIQALIADVSQAGWTGSSCSIFRVSLQRGFLIPLKDSCQQVWF